MMRNVPNKYSRKQLLTLLDGRGFHGTYRLVYLPVDLVTRLSVGYAILNFGSLQDAARFMEVFDGFTDWHFIGSPKVCRVEWSTTKDDSFEAHVEYLRNSPMMHESVPDEFKPALFVDGVRAEFPAPTRSLRKPWLGPSSGHKARRTRCHRG
jgi:hypothetical protein